MRRPYSFPFRIRSATQATCPYKMTDKAGSTNSVNDPYPSLMSEKGMKMINLQGVPKKLCPVCLAYVEELYMQLYRSSTVP